MTSSFISTDSLTSTLRLSAMKSQVGLTKAAKEATTGRVADVGLTLGPLAGRDVVLRAEISRIEKITDTNELVAGRLDSSQAALTSLVETAQNFVKEMLASRGTQTGAEVVLPSAVANLNDLVATLNTTLNGQYLFGGINTAVETMTAYTATSASKAAVDAAFLADFGFNQSSAGVATIDATAMNNFLDTTFATLFADPAWGATWSAASDQVISSRVSTTEVIDTSASANEGGLRKLAMVYTMMSDLGSTNMSEGAYQALVDKAVSLAGTAINDIVLVQGRMGIAQERTKNATEKMAIQKDLLTQQISALESVDPTEAAVRVTALQNQVDAALALIARIQKLSILNYL